MVCVGPELPKVAALLGIDIFDAPFTVAAGHIFVLPVTVIIDKFETN